jgi:spore germination cell wall hydrolase CwlJ-like protein
MIRPVRAAAYAAAAFAFATATLWGGPLQALDADTVPVATPYWAHGTASSELSDLGLNDAAPAAPAAEPADPADSPEARPLDAQVAGIVDLTPRGDEENCLANAVYFEARGESLEGQLAVAEVVMNRAASGRYPASLCGVVRQPAQFSFVRRGVMPRADRGCDAWRRAVAIARIAQAGAVRRVLPANVLWYHANYVSPRWGRRLAMSARIGLHVFYS